LAPGDLSRPIFDTTTPVYDPLATRDKPAAAVVAEVEGRPITLGQVNDAIAALPPGMAKLPLGTLYPSVLEQLIRQQALVVRAREQGLDEDPAVSRRMKAAADTQLSEEYLQRALSKSITEPMLLERYARDIAGRPGPEEVRVQVILTETEKAAAGLIAEIRGGADFAVVARRASKDTSAAGGGELGFATRDGMVPEVGAAAFALAPGQMAQFPVHAAAGWFVVKVAERRAQPTPGFASVREQLRQTLMREGVIAVSTTALQGLKVRSYNLNGTEIGPDNPVVH
jgi:peptidyl-prolyl cis-trans isomerase C